MEDLKLVLLKQDLQIAHDRLDSYLQMQLSAAAEMITREGITLDHTAATDTALQVMYAAYLYRKRAEKENAMPRMLRFALNNLLISQKMRGEPDAT